MDQVHGAAWLTPQILKAYKIFDWTYGIFPGDSFDTSLTKIGNPHYHPFQSTWGSKLHQFCISLLAFVLGFMLLKRFTEHNQMPTGKEIVQLGMVLFYFAWALMFLLTRRQADQTDGLLSIGINKFLDVSQQKLPLKNIPPMQDYAGLLLLYFVIGMNILGTPLPFVLWKMKLDPMLYLFEHFLKPAEMHYLKFLPLAISASAFIGCAIHDLTVLVFICVTTFLAIQARLETLLRLLTRKEESAYCQREIQKLVLKCYREMLVLYAAVEKPLSNIMMYNVVFSQLLLTQLLWIAVNCYGQIHMFIVMSCGSAFVGGLGLIMFKLHIYALSRETSQQIVDQAVGGYKRMFQLRRGGSNQAFGVVTIRCWWAQRALPIKCGARFSFSTDATMNFLSVLTSNLTNALLLIAV